MKIYAKVGESLQQIGGERPNDFIEMKGERPDIDYVADKDGAWIKPITTVTNETIDETTLSIMEAIAAQEERLRKLEGSVTA